MTVLLLVVLVITARACNGEEADFKAKLEMACTKLFTNEIHLVSRKMKDYFDSQIYGLKEQNTLESGQVKEEVKAEIGQVKEQVQELKQQNKYELQQVQHQINQINTALKPLLVFFEWKNVFFTTIGAAIGAMLISMLNPIWKGENMFLLRASEYCLTNLY